MSLSWSWFQIVGHLVNQLSDNECDLMYLTRTNDLVYCNGNYTWKKYSTSIFKKPTPDNPFLDRKKFVPVGAHNLSPCGL